MNAISKNGSATALWKRACNRSSWPSACRPKRPRRSISTANRETCASVTARTRMADNCCSRRLLERGVRFLQVWSGAGQPWDNHDALETNHRNLARPWDQAIAAFLEDLKQRGLFDSTLVMWGGEFGRTPVAELPALSGRDHNHYGFSMRSE